MLSLPRLPRPARYWTVVLILGTAHFGFDFASPFFPIYVQQLGALDPGEAAVWSGLLVGVTPLISSITAPLWGLLADRFGTRFLVMRSLVGFALCNFLMAFAGHPGHLLILRVAMGFFGGFTSLATALVALETPRHQVSRAMGAVQAAQFVPLATAPLVGGLVVDALGVRANFLVSSGLLAVALAILVLTGRRQPATPEAAEPRSAAPGGQLALAVVPLLVSLFAARFVDRSFLPIVPLYLQHIGTPSASLASTTGLVHSAGAIAVSVSAAIAGSLATRRQPATLLVISLASGALVAALLPLAASAAHFIALRVLLGLLAGSAQTLIYTSATHVLPRQYTGRFFGISASVGLLAGALGPQGGGAIAALRLAYVFWVDAALYGLAALCTLAWLGQAVRRPFPSHDQPPAGRPGR